MVVLAAGWRTKKCGCSLRNMLQCSPCQWIWSPASKRGLWSKWLLHFISDHPAGRHRRCLPPGRLPACVAAAAGKHPALPGRSSALCPSPHGRGRFAFWPPPNLISHFLLERTSIPCREFPKPASSADGLFSPSQNKGSERQRDILYRRNTCCMYHPSMGRL